MKIDKLKALYTQVQIIFEKKNKKEKNNFFILIFSIFYGMHKSK
jgi:hypothetical protein